MAERSGGQQLGCTAERLRVLKNPAFRGNGFGLLTQPFEMVQASLADGGILRGCVICIYLYHNFYKIENTVDNNSVKVSETMNTDTNSSLDMAERFQIAYYYVSPQNAERIKAFLELSGDSEKSLITQFVRGWLGRNRNYYLELARTDAEARGISFRQWGETVFKEGIEVLPDYQKELSDVPPNPLRDVALTPDTVRRPLNYITLGVQNLCLLRVAIHYDRDNAIGYISRIVKEHLDRNWEKLYASQVDAENFENWR